MDVLRILFFNIWVVTNLYSFVTSHVSNDRVLLLSLDGFRWDYLDKVKSAKKSTPHFDSLIEGGVRARNGMRNAFITKTAPNHYSIVTGMYEENHGVVGNRYYDPGRNVTHLSFNHNTSEYYDPYFWTNGTLDKWPGEPIWITNQRSTSLVPKYSGAMMWPACDIQIKGEYPSRYVAFNNETDDRLKIDMFVNWYTDKGLPINLGLLYHAQPDICGHSFGPNTPQMVDMIIYLDRLVGYLINKLKEHHIWEEMNLIITSDHGMAETVGTVVLEDHINSSWYYRVPGSPVAQIWPHEGQEDNIYTRLKNVEHLIVYKKEEIPREYHYTFNERIPPILAVAENGYNLCDTREQCPTSFGEHGYNNSDPDMAPVFIAHGPVFRKKYDKQEKFNNVDIYPLLCHILDLEPAQHDGSLDNVKDMLAPHSSKGTEMGSKFLTTTAVTFLLVVVFAALFSGVWCVAACRTNRTLTRKLRISVGMPLDGFSYSNKQDGQTHLLTSDEEEIP